MLYDLVAKPLRFAYSEFGGTDEIMKLLEKRARADIRPAIVIAFNEPLSRSESEAEALLATVAADDFDAGDLQDTAVQSRLDRILLTLNEAIHKRAIEQAARAVQRGFRAKTARRQANRMAPSQPPPAQVQVLDPGGGALQHMLQQRSKQLSGVASGRRQQGPKPTELPLQCVSA